MWDTAKQQRFDELRRRERTGTLTDGERRILEQLLHEIEQEEWATLQPALQRLRQEQKQLQGTEAASRGVRTPANGECHPGHPGRTV